MKQLLFSIALLGAATAQADINVNHLRVCGLTEPLGLDVTPTFAWQTESTERGFVQQGYQIVVTTDDGTEVWNTGRVESRRQNDIKYEGTALASRTAYQWTVTVWGADESAQAKGKFETAFLSPTEWQAAWIAPDQASVVRSRFDVPMQGAVKARYVKIDMTALGLRASTDAGLDYFQLSEVEVMENGKNVAKGCKVSSNKAWELTNYGWSATYLTDGIIVGSTNGFTSTQMQGMSGGSVWVTIDLGQERDVEAIVIYPRQSDCAQDGKHACNFPKDFTVESSADDKSYSVIYTAKGMEAPEYADLTSRIPYIGTTFTVPEGKEVKRARMYATALGIFTMDINGQPATDAVLEPGETEYNKTVLYSTYDVTSLLHTGENMLMAQVAGGIYSITRAPGRYSKDEINNVGTPSLKAELHVEYTDGTTDLVLTDNTWRTAYSRTVVSNWYGGEDYDATIITPPLPSPQGEGAEQSPASIGKANDKFPSPWGEGWGGVVVIDAPTINLPIGSGQTNPVGTLRSRDYEPLRVVETWKAVKVTRLGDKHYVVDFGRNFAGQYTFTLKGERGEYIRLQPGETLDSDGGCNVQYYYSSNSLTYDAYTFAGRDEGETWGPKFMYHGFRYLEITGLSVEPRPEDFTAMRIRSDMAQVSRFETSNTLINQIHTICRDAIQSQLYNSITDCPQREKLGWLDVPNEMYNSLIYNYDMETFWRKVLLDCFDAQYENGKVPSTVPHYMIVYDDDPNWGGASVLVPYRSLRTYGDLTTVERYYPQMKRLVDYYTSLTNGYIMPGASYSVLSDWGQNTCGLAQETAPEFTITTTYYYLLRCMAEMAELTNRPADAATFNETADKVKAAFNKKFFNPTTCVYAHGNQAEYGMALYYGLVEDEYRDRVVENLVKSVADANYKIKTGEIGLKPLFMSLAEGGHNDVVWRMANQTDYPSYGYWVKQGCTTTPEYWDLSLSQNHCMMDHIEEWFFSQLAGIRNTGTGFDTFIIQPYMPDDLKQMYVATQSVYGEIVSSYERVGSGIRYQFTVPANSQATIMVPLSGDGVPRNEQGTPRNEQGIPLAEHGVPLSADTKGVISVSYADGFATVVVGSGTYVFTTGTLTDEDSAANETFWTTVHDGAQLTQGSVLKVQEQAGRFLGTCTANLQAEGGFVTGSTFDQTPAMTVSAIKAKTMDKQSTPTFQLVDEQSGYGFGQAQQNGDMLGWRKAAKYWGFDVVEGDARMFRGDRSQRSGGYVFFYDNGANSGVNTYGTKAQAAKLQLHKLFPIDSTEVLTVGAPFVYYRQCLRTGGYETICLPIDVETLPADYTFFRPVSLDEGVLSVEPVASLVAGRPYLMRYEGAVQSQVPVTVTFSGTIVTAAPETDILTPAFARVPAAGQSVVNGDGTVVPAASDIYPFRAYLAGDDTRVTGYKAGHDTGTYTLGGVKVNVVSRPGLYVVGGRKVAAIAY